ncbi:uncharacterized protein LOC133871503 [Alnus glutinosa]|uniref:uncharacterized protein LOC133871503 n=1 Tax=Alnus glutinosa TaxID=3517 RepID=UPI002D7A06E7|nr:uncharacterized protein LOC133871503 [Alnus glutinosa]
MPLFPPPLSVTTAALLSSVPSNVIVLTQDLADELVLVDTKLDKLRGEMLDLQHAVAFFPHTKIHASVDYAVTVGSDLYIVTAEARQILDSSNYPSIGSSFPIISTLADPHRRSLTPSTMPITRLRLCWDSFHFARSEYSKK